MELSVCHAGHAAVWWWDAKGCITELL